MISFLQCIIFEPISYSEFILVFQTLAVYNLAVINELRQGLLNLVRYI